MSSTRGDAAAEARQALPGTLRTHEERWMEETSAVRSASDVSSKLVEVTLLTSNCGFRPASYKSMADCRRPRNKVFARPKELVQKTGSKSLQ